MVLIDANPISSQAMLARKAGIMEPSLVGIIDELERRGLVSRIRSDRDRRRNQLVLTEEGEGTMRALFGSVKEIEAPIREEFSPEELDQFMHYLDRAISASAKR